MAPTAAPLDVDGTFMGGSTTWKPKAETSTICLSEHGIFAIDSKWHGHSLTAETLRRDQDRAAASARRARSILRSVSTPHEVQPVIVIWGGQQAHVPSGGVMRDDVWFGQPQFQSARRTGRGPLLPRRKPGPSAPYDISYSRWCSHSPRTRSRTQPGASSCRRSCRAGSRRRCR
jgi:hypothetical protein